MNLYGRSLVKVDDLKANEFFYLVKLATTLKHAKQNGVEVPELVGKKIALIFEKPSTRTRSAFEVAALDQGAHPVYIGPGESHLGVEESPADTGKVLSRMYDGIEFRGFTQESVERLDQAADVPVWNGLTDRWHPTQMLADVLTMTEHTTKEFGRVVLTYVGDGRNNTARSLLVTGALLGFEIRIVSPKELTLEDTSVLLAKQLAENSGARLVMTENIEWGLHGTDFLYTDVWLSMGEPEEAWKERIDLLREYQVNEAMIRATHNPEVKFMHCLPSLHDQHSATGARLSKLVGTDGVEVTDEVFSSQASIVFDQAENRLHTIKALMLASLRGH
ncbi:ornithine carbamoyltransferase [Ferrimicrobium sp.]|uniref:ornithine carbamoyltransferase n=1 Tax=Ferrimicrobium sp. TaxID=2926050 RepID=UPI00261ADC1E|nr:ornithine carbamoyltransferase [Ferrimicrobium sp.]